MMKDEAQKEAWSAHYRRCIDIMISIILIICFLLLIIIIVINPLMLTAAKTDLTILIKKF